MKRKKTSALLSAIFFLIGRRSESRAKACFRMAERGGTKKGLIPRSSAAERAEGAGARLCLAVLISFIGALSSCAGAAPLQSAVNPLENTYWKAVEINSDGESIIDEFWADAFLWKGGAGCFRFSEATVESDYYGMREVFDCDWSLENGKLALVDKTKSDGSTVIHTGVSEQNRLVITYSSFYLHENVRVTMEQASMPAYGAQWEMPELYGTWKMVSYSDKGKVVSTEKLARYFCSELAIYPTFMAEFLLDDQDQYTELETDLFVKYTEGPLWDGCVNQAWHVELARSLSGSAGGFPTGKKYYAAYADGRLFFMRKDIDYRDTGYPLNFTAEFELIGMYVPLSEPQGFFSPKTPD